MNLHITSGSSDCAAVLTMRSSASSLTSQLGRMRGVKFHPACNILPHHTNKSDIRRPFNKSSFIKVSPHNLTWFFFFLHRRSGPTAAGRVDARRHKSGKTSHGVNRNTCLNEAAAHFQHFSANEKHLHRVSRNGTSLTVGVGRFSGGPVRRGGRPGRCGTSKQSNLSFSGSCTFLGKRRIWLSAVSPPAAQIRDVKRRSVFTDVISSSRML